MAERLTVEVDKKPAYDIVFETSFDALAGELDKFELNTRKVCIITDSNVEKLYAEEVAKVVSGKCQKCVVYVFPAGEENKNLKTVQNAYEFLIQNQFDRKDLLIALGGGVVGDLTGFVAATYLRGVSFIQIPTTLLSQVDSSIGGKTGVDFDSYKNMVGAFYEWLIDNFVEIGDRELDIITEMVKRSCVIKKNVVEKDPTEQGERALLNLGHTIGHAIEKQMNFQYLHGECVALRHFCLRLLS